jgi:hypothetical protein
MDAEAIKRKDLIKAIEISLERARDYIQKDLKAKFGYGENIFFYNDLIEYRINNSLLDIAEKLAIEHGQTVEERYDLINDQPVGSVSRAFRGHHNKEFMPKYRLEGLFSKETNDMIKGIRNEKVGLKVSDMINPETGERYVVEGGRKAMSLLSDEERIELGQKGYANGLANLTSEELSEFARNGGLKGGLRGYWKDNPKHLDTLDRIVGASIGKGKYITKPSWDYVHTNFNEETGLKMSKKALQCVQRRYNSNRDKEE